VLICWKLDRLSRSLSDLLRILQKVDQAGAKFKSLTDELDTTTPMRRMVMQVVGSFAEFERLRTKLGLARARANGRVGGGRYKLSASQQAEAIK
jgi:DNA invertase Pin-like site-specific DNA recombinase